MKRVVLCMSNIDDVSLYKDYSKTYLTYSDYNLATIGLGKNTISFDKRIEEEIKSGDFSKNEALLITIEHAAKNKSRLHIVGDIKKDKNNLLTILRLCNELNVMHVYVHFYHNSKVNQATLNKKLGVGLVGNLIDSKNDIKATDVYNSLVNGKKNSDIVVVNNGRITNGDSIIFYNNDVSMYEDLITLLRSKSSEEVKVKKFKDLKILTILPYNGEDYMYNTEGVCIGKYISDNGGKQLRCNINAYEFDGNKNLKAKGIKNTKESVLDVDISKYDLVVTELDGSLIPELKKKVDEADATLVIISKNENNALMLVSKKVSLRKGTISGIAGTVIDLCGLKVTRDFDKSLITSKLYYVGFVFRMLSRLFIMLSVFYYAARLLYAYITK